MPSLRTTVTLEPDVAEELKALARRRNISFKAALNDNVRAGLATERGVAGLTRRQCDLWGYGRVWI